VRVKSPDGRVREWKNAPSNTVISALDGI